MQAPGLKHLLTLRGRLVVSAATAGVGLIITSPAVLSAAADSSAAVSHSSRLCVAENHRHLVDERGKAFFYSADTPWIPFLKLTQAEAGEYIAHRKEQGFTALQVVLTGFLRMSNRAGELPFAGRPPEQGFAQPNERFFFLDFADKHLGSP